MAPPVEVPQITAPGLEAPGKGPASAAPDNLDPGQPPAVAETEFASIDPALVVPPLGAAMSAAPDDTDASKPDVQTPAEAVCKAGDRAPFQSAFLGQDAAGFGLRLAAAALEQTKDFVVYTAKYRRIAYPMGDLPALHGACSDLVIRAYRALGIDLQQLVQMARLGHDTNIDHRRTETLRKLFARYGQSIPVSAFPEDYEPGDIVTYYRPFSRVSRAHIAIVADVLAPSGRPMIVHNRGWGPQLEDALFSDRVTGHYRFTGPRMTAEPKAKTPAKAVFYSKRPSMSAAVLARRKRVSATILSRPEPLSGL